MDNRPIGVFDSGFGGLTAVRALESLVPNENIVYFADTARVPYGNRSPRELRKMALQDLDFVSGKGVKTVLVACGTVSSNAGDIIKSYPVPAFGVIDGAVEALSGLDRKSTVGVIATAASIKNGAFEKKIRELYPEMKVISVPCPEFVPLIEAGRTEKTDSGLMNAIEKYLAPIKAAGAAAVILGCTHYGLIGEALRAYLGESTQLVEAACCAAEKIKAYLEENGLSGGSGEARFFTSGDPKEFSPLAARFLGHEVRGSVAGVEAMEI